MRPLLLSFAVLLGVGLSSLASAQDKPKTKHTQHKEHHV